MEERIDILLVDDEPRNLDALEAILAEPDYRLLRANSPNDALRLLLEFTVAAIVMDVKMPGLSGFELAHLIKGSKRTRQIPILFLTGYLIDEHDALEGYGAGAVDYLTKPINPQILRRKVAVFADLFRKTRALAELNEKLEARVLERTAELEERERELLAVTDHTPDIMMRFNRRLELVWANPAAIRANEERRLEPAISHRWTPCLKEVFTSHQEQRIEFEESGLSYSTSFVPEIRMDGQVEHVLVVTHDITERVKAARDLRASEARLEMSLAAGRMGRFELDLRTGIATIDAAEAALLGLPTTSAIGLSQFYEMVHPEDRVLLQDAVEKATSGDGHCQSEFRLVRPDGKVVWLLGHGQLIRDDHGSPVSFAGIHIDVTSRRLADEALKDAARQKDQFIATLAHELRNPLAPLRTGLAVLNRTETPAAVVARTMEIMNRQLDHMVRLIDDLLDVSRISRGVLELKKERSRLKAIIETAVESCKPLFDQRKQSIAVNADDDIFAEIDPTRVCQILGNLLHNAGKFSAERGVVRIEVERDNTIAILRVIDFGLGIPQEMLGRIFEMFGQNDRRGGGLGIGLALARRLAELHGGTLTAWSEGKGMGSTFTLRLPIGPIGTEAAASRKNGLEKPVVVSSGAVLDVLIIEDNVDAAETLVIWLENHGHRVSVAHTGEDGLDRLSQARPDVVLCDIGLPEMDGLEVCRRVRAANDGRPVMIALTGWGMEEDRQRTKTAGFDYHLVKPVAVERLREILAEIEPSCFTT